MTIHNPLATTSVFSGRGVTAVLGPTNTGKTHLAIERMVAHSSGVIGLPLRLLAREVYARVGEKVGVGNVSLITGEEKIVPPGARYSVCTVEAMPRQTDAAFVAIDEVQLADDLERGHVFTDRILNLRGREETLLLGASTMRGILERLLGGVSVVTRPRMSTLSYVGSRKLTRLPERSAIVAFSADEVYAIAELIRRQRGGAAVVLGALSPRTRNKQVEIYQSGDVDYLIATDAIGMGLNLDVDHVAFAQNRKFDGFQHRELTPGELGQIAGRAGRHIRDGTFGVTARVDPFDAELVEKIEAHDFQPVRVLQWRTAGFDFSSIDALKASIETAPGIEGLAKALPAVDQRALEHLSNDEDVRRYATGGRGVELLWEACALPDYRRISPAEHAELILAVYTDLMRRGHVDETYLAGQVARAESTEGDIDVLSRRIAQIRTWTFVSHRPGWLADPTHWQEKTREIEDRLSDALHERLTKRFIDRRTSVLMRRLRENAMIEAEISPSGAVLVEGHHVGELDGFRFTADPSAGGEDARAVKAAAQKALAAEFEARAERFAASGNGDFALGFDGVLRWGGQPVGVTVAGDDPLKPRVVMLADEQLTGPARDKVQARAERFVNFRIETHLKPLLELKASDTLSGIARGLAFRLVENFGIIDRREVAEDVKSLDQEARGALRRLGVRFGAYHIFVPALLKPAPAELATLLFALSSDAREKPGFGEVVTALAAGRTSLALDETFERDFYRLGGFRVLGRRAVRVDILERLADLIRPALAWKPGQGRRPDGGFDGAAFLVTPAMMSILGAKAEDMEEILMALGYRGEAKPALEVEARLEKLDADAEAAIRAEKEARERAAAEAAERTEEAAMSESVAPDGSPVAAVAEEPPTEIPATGTETVDGNDVGGSFDAVAAEAGSAVQPSFDDTLGTGSSNVAAPADQPSDEPSSAADGKDSAPQAAAADAEDALPPEEPKPILVWRPARFEGHGRRGPRREAGKGGKGRAGFRGRRDGPATEGAPRADGKSGEENVRGKGGRKDRGKGRDRDKEVKRDDRREWNTRPPRQERPARIDPDSPFAKLAALRDQLKK
ncbi:MAG: helicase [Rhizobiaceae bacterium]|nr:helicase [Rhizobiaceae bacterium]MCV0404613.1 helicase [Rhizobiaceae bacterium]